MRPPQTKRARKSRFRPNQHTAPSWPPRRWQRRRSHVRAAQNACSQREDDLPHVRRAAAPARQPHPAGWWGVRGVPSRNVGEVARLERPRDVVLVELGEGLVLLLQLLLQNALILGSRSVRSFSSTARRTISRTCSIEKSTSPVCRSMRCRSVAQSCSGRKAEPQVGNEGAT